MADSPKTTDSDDKKAEVSKRPSTDKTQVNETEPNDDYSSSINYFPSYEAKIGAKSQRPDDGNATIRTAGPMTDNTFSHYRSKPPVPTKNNNSKDINSSISSGTSTTGTENATKTTKEMVKITKIPPKNMKDAVLQKNPAKTSKLSSKGQKSMPDEKVKKEFPEYDGTRTKEVSLYQKSKLRKESADKKNYKHQDKHAHQITVFNDDTRYRRNNGCCGADVAPRIPTFKLCFVSLLVSLLGYGLSGYPLGVVSITDHVIDNFTNTSFREHYGYVTTNSTISILRNITTNCWYIGAASGSLITGWAADRYGRRIAIFVLPVFTAWIATGCYIGGYYLNAFEAVLVGRFIDGIAGGMASVAVPAYIAEFTPPECRGLLLGWRTVIGSIWMMLGMVLGSEIAMGTNSIWSFLYGIPAVIVTPLACIACCMPETPAYLYVFKQDEDRAKKRINEFFGRFVDKRKTMTNYEWELIISKGRKLTLPRAWRRESLRLYIVLAFVVAISNAVSGEIPLRYFIHGMFEHLGYKNITEQYLSMIPVLLMTVFGFLTPFLLDCVGRRKLLLSSLTGILVSLSLYTVIGTLHEQVGLGDWTNKVMICIVCFAVICYGCGAGPIPYIIGIEILPTPARFTIVSMANAVGFVLKCFIAFMFPFAYTHIGSISLIPFTILPILGCLVYLWLFLPETSQKLPIDFGDRQDVWASVSEDQPFSERFQILPVKPNVAEKKTQTKSKDIENAVDDKTDTDETWWKWPKFQIDWAKVGQHWTKAGAHIQKSAVHVGKSVSSAVEKLDEKLMERVDPAKDEAKTGKEAKVVGKTPGTSTKDTIPDAKAKNVIKTVPPDIQKAI